MNIKYHPHVVDRVLQSNITTQEVELVLTDPDGIIKQSKHKFIYYKKLKGRKNNDIAAVTLLQSKDDFDVITVMIDFEVN